MILKILGTIIAFSLFIIVLFLFSIFNSMDQDIITQKIFTEQQNCHKDKFVVVFHNKEKIITISCTNNAIHNVPDKNPKT